jgi:hypothetical protein
MGPRAAAAAVLRTCCGTWPWSRGTAVHCCSAAPARVILGYDQRASPYYHVAMRRPMGRAALASAVLASTAAAAILRRRFRGRPRAQLN